MQKEIVLCDFKGCEKPASHHYRWEWGAEGNCCPGCVPLLQQTSGNISRTVQFTNLDNAAVQPVNLSERTQLIAAKLAAEGELKLSQLRGHDLYNQNVELTRQIQTHTLRERSHGEQVETLEQKIDQLGEKLASREAELGMVSAEVQRLRTLVQFAEAPSRVGSERGLEQG